MDFQEIEVFNISSKSKEFGQNYSSSGQNYSRKMGKKGDFENLKVQKRNFSTKSVPD